MTYNVEKMPLWSFKIIENYFIQPITYKLPRAVFILRN